MKLMVEGMNCGHCIRAITQAIQRLDEHAQVSVDLAQKTVLIEGRHEGRLSLKDATSAIERDGYRIVSVIDPA